jgi:hypothetical protein
MTKHPCLEQANDVLVKMRNVCIPIAQESGIHNKFKSCVVGTDDKALVPCPLQTAGCSAQCARMFNLWINRETRTLMRCTCDVRAGRLFKEVELANSMAAMHGELRSGDAATEVCLTTLESLVWQPRCCRSIADHQGWNQ